MRDTDTPLVGNTIINLDTKDGQGTHWVAVKVMDGCVIYFDSFGLPVPTEIRQRMKATKKKCFWTTDAIQDIKSEACGWYCLAFLKQVKTMEDLPVFLSTFNPKSLKANDGLLDKML